MRAPCSPSFADGSLQPLRGATRSDRRAGATCGWLPLPGLAVLCGVGVEALAARASGLRNAIAAIVVVPIALVLGAGPMRDALAIPPERRWGVDELPCVGTQDEAAAAVRAVTEPGERIYVATGQSASYIGQQIYWQARRLPATRFIFARDVVPPPYADLADDLERNPPAAIVLMPDPLPAGVAEAIRAGGLRTATTIDCGDGLVIEVLA